MKKTLSIILVLCLFISVLPVFGTAQTEVLNGDYVVIVNTNPNPGVTQSTGNIVFDSSGEGTASGTASEPIASNGVTVPAVTGTPAAGSKTYTVGSAVSVRNMNYTCIAVGDYCYIWMENSLKSEYDSLGKTAAAATEMKNVYEGKPYSVLNTLANGSIPYLDGSNKLSILMEHDAESTAAGYYGMEKDITAVHINCPAGSGYMSGSLDGRNGLLAHEGQHALFQTLAAEGYSTSGYRWLDEGLAITAMEWTWGMQSSSQWLSYIEGSSAIKQGASLVYENYRSNTALDYSLPALYVRYLANRYSQKYAPLMFMQELYKVKLYNNSNADSQKTVEQYLNDVFAALNIKNSDNTVLTFRQSLVDFYTACVKQDVSGINSFYGDVTVYNSIKNYPVYMGTSGAPVQLAGTSAIVVKTVDGTFSVPQSHGSDIKYISVNKTNEPYLPSLGSGTEADPYIISNAFEFTSALSQYPNSCFKLSADINLSGTVYSSCDSFFGVLDGQGHTVSGINRSLIYENNGIIKNLKLVGAANDEYLGTAALLVEQNYGIIQDTSVGGVMSPRIIGSGIRYTPVWGTLAAVNTTLGKIERCFSTAEVTLVIDANVSHDTVAGNLIGKNSGAVRDCYSAGRLSVTRVGTSAASYFVGGLAGYAGGGMSNPFYRCYSVTEVANNGSGGSTDVQIGRFAGSFGGYVYLENNYSLSGMVAVGNNSSIAEKSESEMKTQSTYSGWGFGSVWKLPSDSYPVFMDGSDITSVEAVGSPSIFIGQTLDYLSLMYIQVKINSDSNNLVDMEADMADLSTLDSSTEGIKTVSCNYRGHSFNLTVNVITPSAVSELAVYTPGKTSYVIGSNYDMSGVVLKAKLNNAAYFSYIYSGFSNNKAAALTAADTSVTYTYCSQTATQSLSVSELSVSGIEVVSVPDNSIYASGELIDLTNLGAKLHYNDGTVSATMELNDLLTLGVKLAKRSASGVFLNLDLNESVTVEDNGAAVYLYYGSVLPTDQNEVIKSEVITLSVQERMSLDDQIVVLKLGKAYDYAETEPINGSGYVSVSLVSGSLPAGVSVYTPWEAGEYFGFAVNSEAGIQGSIKDYPLTYKIENETTGQILYVNITIRVQPKSNLTSFEYVKLRMSQNAGKLTSDINGVIDSTAGTVTLSVPYGTSKTLTLEYMAAEGGSVKHPDGGIFFNGSYDFGSVNPVPCVVVAEDGTEKSFNIYLDEQSVPSVSVNGIEDGGEYCVSAPFTVSGENITSVTDNGNPLTAPYSVSTAGQHKIVVTNAYAVSTEVNITIYVNHTEGTAANCTAKAVCSVCGLSYGEKNPANHSGDTEVRNAIAATCTKAGYTGDTYCLGCNEKLSSGSAITELSHNWVVANQTPATCCSVSVTSYACSLCGETKTENGTQFNPANHTGGTEVRNISAATCTKAGYTGDTYCLGCNEKISSGSAITVLSHNWVVANQTPATCCSVSVTSYACSLCSETKTENGTQFNASNHTGGTEVRNISAATCTKAGYTGDTYCLGCNEKLSSGSAITVLSHNWVVTNQTPATCCSVSVTSYACSLCGETKTENGTQLNPANHSGGTEVRNISAATCSKAGYTGDTYCLGCNEKLSSGSAITVLSHNWVVANQTPATCCSVSVTSYACSLCGETKTENGTQFNASNHSGDTEVRNAIAATCTKAGYTGDTYCLGCNKISVAGTQISKIAHSYTTEVIAPTCTANGYTVYTCTVCGYSYDGNSQPTVAHTDANSDSKCDVCGATINNSCSHMCHKTGFMGFIWKIVCFFCKLFGTNQYCSCGAAHY